MINENTVADIEEKGSMIVEKIEQKVEDIKNYYYIIVMDLCSSSVILEKLQTAGKIKVWRSFWKKIYHQLKTKMYYNSRCRPYKFVGDGFIILYRHQYDGSLFEFMQKLNEMSCNFLKEILEEYQIQPKRFGFCYGIDRGIIIPMHLLGKHEYVGEAINAATRLQGLLKENEDACSVMVADHVYERLSLPKDVRQKEKECILRNLYNDKNTCCHQIWL